MLLVLNIRLILHFLTPTKCYYITESKNFLRNFHIVERIQFWNDSFFILLEWQNNGIETQNCLRWSRQSLCMCVYLTELDGWVS